MIKEILLSLAVAAFSGVSSFVGSPNNAASDDTIVLPQNWSIIGVANTYIRFDGYPVFTVADGATEYIPDTSTSVSVDWGYDNFSEPFINISFANIGTEDFSVRVDGFVDYQYSRVQNVGGGFLINVWGQDAVSFVEDERNFTAWVQIVATDYPTDQFYGTYSGGFTQSVNLADYEHRHISSQLDSSNGGLFADSGTYVTPFIPVKPNTSYTKTAFGASYGCQYDEYGQFLRFTQMNGTFTTPNDCYFLRFNGGVNFTRPILVEGSSLPESYTAYNASWSLSSPYTNFYTPVHFDDTQFEYVGTLRFDDNYFIADFAYIEFKGFNSQEEMYQFFDSINLGLSDATTSNISFEGNSESNYELGFVIEDKAESASFSFTIGPEAYAIFKSLINCSINSTPAELPNTYQTAQVGQTYTIYGSANQDLTGSYGFNSSSLTITGVTTSNFYLYNEIDNTGFYRGCSFSITLPANDITIRLQAFQPDYSITATLNNCTVSPSVPSSYSGIYSEDFTFTAADGYAFNSLVTSWEFSANITAQEPTFSGRLYGSLYQSVTFRLVFENGNCEFRITAAKFDLDSYQEGYDNGYTNGYERGHADGLIAGDSYGVWNWLKQAARTTGEFLNIPLLPGFSIGGLLTALAGLVIIWFFIKGFLFKS